jgi:hypothetical protein
LHAAIADAGTALRGAGRAKAQRRIKDALTLQALAAQAFLRRAIAVARALGQRAVGGKVAVRCDIDGISGCSFLASIVG